MHPRTCYNVDVVHGKCNNLKAVAQLHGKFQKRENMSRRKNLFFSLSTQEREQRNKHTPEKEHKRVTF